MEKFKEIKLLVTDFDGVHTDNRVLVSEDGKESIFCDRADGLGIEMLKKKGIEVFVISKEKNKVIQARCDKLKIDCWHGIDDKITLFKKEVGKRGVSLENVCFIGNDINDLECIEIAGIGVAVADSYPQVLEIANYITKAKGGHGAIREICDLILAP